MAVRLDSDTPLLGSSGARFATRITQTLRRQVKREHALPSRAGLDDGVLTAIQRVRDDLGLSGPPHAMVADPDETVAALHGPSGPPRPHPEPRGQRLTFATI